MLSRSRATLSMGNCLPCTVQSIHQDQVESFVSLELGDGSRLFATVETPGLLRVGIHEGQKVYAHFPSRPRACVWTDISRKGPPFRTGGASSTNQGVVS